MAAQMGYAAIVSATSAFGMVIGIFSGLPLPAELTFGIFASISGFLSGDSIAGLAFSSNVFLPMAETIGVSAGAMHRIALFAVSILDTIPICGGVIAMLRAAAPVGRKAQQPGFYRNFPLYSYIKAAASQTYFLQGIGQGGSTPDSFPAASSWEPFKIPEMISGFRG